MTSLINLPESVILVYESVICIIFGTQMPADNMTSKTLAKVHKDLIAQ